MQLCDCMYKQQEDGSYACVKCHGDIYACECRVRHTINCTEHTCGTDTGVCIKCDEVKDVEWFSAWENTEEVF